MPGPDALATSRPRPTSRPTSRLRLLVAAATLALAAGCASGAEAPRSGVPADAGTAPATDRPADPAGAEGPDAPEGPPGVDAPGLPSADVTLPRLTLVRVADLEAPIATAVLGDGRVLIAERAGRVRVLGDDGAGTPLLDLTGRTTTDGERGLLDITVAPWGDELLVSRTDEAGDTLVEAYPLDGTRIVDTPRTVYALPQPFSNHNGGALLFLPDGTLLLGLGDGGGAGDPLRAAQDLATPLGGLVRLDVRDGTRVPADNPYVGIAGAAPELAAIGLRNPWRMSLDADRDELWIADVGQDASEEIDRVAVDALLGANFGWPLREGSAGSAGDEPDGYVAPVHTYAHGPGCSVTGGHVYRGTALPQLVGGYVFSDLCDGELRVLLADGDGTVARPLGVRASQPIGFGRDADGELLVLELGGAVLRLERG